MHHYSRTWATNILKVVQKALMMNNELFARTGVSVFRKLSQLA